MHADHREDVTEIRAGDIGAVLGFKESFTGDTFCDTKALVLETFPSPNRLFRLLLNRKVPADQEKMGEALRKLGRRRPDIPRQFG
jgi:elongation factor G